MAEHLQQDTRIANSHRIASALTAGNIVTIAIQLFRKQSDDYITTSLQSNLWFFLTILGASCLGGVGYVLGQSLGFGWTNIVLLVVVFSLPLLAYGRGRKIATGGMLSRIIFNQLINRSETKTEIQQRIFPRIWAYFRAELLFWLVLSGIYVGFAFILGFILRTLFSSVRAQDIIDFFINTEFNVSSLLTLIATIGLFLLLYIGVILFFSYFVARLWLFDVMIALEDVTAIQAITRSWQLTRTQGWQSLAVVLICGLLLIPPFLVSSSLSFFGVFGLLFVAIMAFPLYQATKAVMYYDLRSRNEGLTFDLNIVAKNPQTQLQRVILQTPESIELDLSLGGIGSRALAWAIDQFLLWIGIFLFWYFGSVLYLTILLPILTHSFSAFKSGDLNQWVEAIAAFLTFILSNGYFIAFETFWQGQTPGKRVVRIRVVRDSGQPVGIKESSIRSLLSTVDVFFFFIGVLLIGVTKSEKRLGDLVAGTLVIQNQQQGTNTNHYPLDFSPHSSHISETLMDKTNIEALTPDQFLTLRDFLGYRSRLAVGMRSQTTTKLANQIRQLLGPNNQPLSLGIDDLELVEATYLACQQANQS